MPSRPRQSLIIATLLSISAAAFNLSAQAAPAERESSNSRQERREANKVHPTQAATTADAASSHAKASTHTGRAKAPGASYRPHPPVVVKPQTYRADAWQTQASHRPEWARTLPEAESGQPPRWTEKD